LLACAVWMLLGDLRSNLERADEEHH